MRIAELTTYTSRLNGGVFYALTGLLPRLALKTGAEMRVFGYADSNTESDREAWFPIPVDAFAPWPPRHFGFSPRFFSALRRFRPEIIHAHGIWTYLSAASLRVHRKDGVPLIVSPHGMLDSWALGFSPIKKKAIAWLFQKEQLKAASVIHALNESEAKSIRAFGLTNPIVVIPNGVDLPKDHDLSAPWQVSTEGRDRTLLFLSRIHPKKGLDLLFDAWNSFSCGNEEGKRWQLIIAGWDEIGYEKELRARVLSFPNRKSVQFVGPLFGEKKSAAFRHADAFILPSYSEGLPMSVLEAWAYSKPVLMSTACNLPEGKSASAAFVFEPNRAAVSHALGCLGDASSNELESMGNAGRQLVVDNFSWGKISSDMETVYRAVVRNEPLPRHLLFQG